MKMLDKQRLRSYLNENRKRHIDRIAEFIRQPTLPSENEGVEKTAEMVASYYRQLGCKEVEIVPTKGYPGVWAYYENLINRIGEGPLGGMDSNRI